MLFVKKITQTQFAISVVLCVLALSFLREPLFFLQPRIWAEEGTVHIQSVFNNGLWLSLFQPHLGYYSLFNNYTVALGLFFLGLEKLPYLTTILSSVVSAGAILAPLFLTSKSWSTPTKKLLLIAFSLSIGTAEMWANTINAQFYFGLFTCFLLLSETEKINGWRSIYVVTMLINAAFTGITSVILFPFFVWKYLRQKAKTNLEKVILVILLIGLVVQLTAVLYLSTNSALSRFSLNNVPNLPYGFFRNITSFVPAGDSIIRLFFTVSIIALAHQKGIRIGYKNPAVIAIYVSFTFAFLALDMGGGGRYGYIPAVLIFIFLMDLRPARNAKLNTFHTGVVAIILCASSIQFFKKTSRVYNPSWTPYSLENVYTNSAGELEIKIFPQGKNTNWVLTLPEGKYENYK